ncbi:MAG: transcription elongation factor GreB [Burkholderiales bacterium]|jgi:transcription elongation factor GreB|nr:transcription elongation factor GreB [Burkholderiales bacterium]
MQDKNYITTEGYERLKIELHNFVTVERPFLVQTITWAASNGDRSENADYIYGKKKLREMDKQIYRLTKKLENAEVVDCNAHIGNEKIFFGARVTVLRNHHIQQTVRIVGQDEIDTNQNYISWTSPLAKFLLGKTIGDVFMLRLPSGVDEIEVIDVGY